MKLSVIIPVYNAESYLRKCVESVLAIPIDKEVILVDDGSKDKSGDICDELAHSQDLVSVIHQENRGVSAARNCGIEIAKGDKVWFVDADDYVINNGVDLHDDSNLNDSHLIILGYLWDENGEAKSFGASEYEIPYNLWRCWFDRQTIERYKLRFTEGRKYAEDQEFILKFFLSSGAKTKGLISAIKSPVYYYTLRPGSAMTKSGMKTKMVLDISSVFLAFFFKSLASFEITQNWVWKEMKRLSKTLYVTIVK
ncbi:MAG: glycosyltransferase family 2 protein [Bacteroidales bacterium]|nr:glycosyltransferase family 2 protein [Bacteroidales bacterium]